MINSDSFTTSECCVLNNYVFMELDFQVTFINMYLIKITTRKKLFRDQYLATKWNGC